MRNRRRSTRYQVSCPVLIREAGGDEASLTADISAHGLAIFSNKERPERQYVEMQIEVPTATTPLRVTAVVARAGTFPDPDGQPKSCTGLDFFLLDKTTKMQWQEFLFKLAKEGEQTFSDNLLSRQQVKDKLRQLNSVAGNSDSADGVVASEHVHFAEDHASTDRMSYILKPEGLGKLWTFYREEINCGRLKLECPHGQPSGTDVDVVLVHPSSHGEWVIRGNVIGCHEKDSGHYQVQIQLPEWSTDEDKQFKSFVATGQGMFCEDVLVDSTDLRPPARQNTQDLEHFAAQMDDAAVVIPSGEIRERSSTLAPTEEYGDEGIDVSLAPEDLSP